MYPLGPLTRALREAGLRTHIETSGAYPLTGTWDWICFSPKKFKLAHESIFDEAHELKVIVRNKSDFDWAEDYADKVNDRCELFLQPEWSVEKKALPVLIDYVKAHPKWKISLQVHKHMDIP
jgi:organic radical activating enzyme